MTKPSNDFNRKTLQVRTSPSMGDTYQDNIIIADWILKQMDKAGGRAAYKFVKNRVVTVGIEAMSFHKPIYDGDDIKILTKIAYAGKSSIGVEIEAWATSPKTGKEDMVTKGLFTFVAIGKDRKPVKIKNRHGITDKKPSLTSKQKKLSNADSKPRDELPQRLQNEIPSRKETPYPKDSNPSGDIFGGWLLAEMDRACARRATDETKKSVVTVGLEAMTFHKPVFVGDDVSSYTRVVKTGDTSVSIEVETWAQRLHNLKYEKVTEGVFTFVAVDENRNKIPIKDKKTPKI